MVRVIALILSILLQFIASFIAFRLTRTTKYKISWILISTGFLVMAIRRLIDFYQYVKNDYNESLNLFNDWMAVAISVFISIGVIIIPEIFTYIKKVELSREADEKRILNAIIQTEEKERMRFAKDLHDGLGPLLSTIKLSVSALIKNNKDQAATEILQNIENITDEAIHSIKEVSNNISPYVLNHFGLDSAVKSFTGKITENKLLKINYLSNLDNKRFDQNIETICYRTVCELINNSIKHSGCDQIALTINATSHTLEVIYDDNGKGFDTSILTEASQKGMGLGNILSRIRSTNGYIDIESSADNGFKAYISIQL